MRTRRLLIFLLCPSALLLAIGCEDLPDTGDGASSALLTPLPFPRKAYDDDQCDGTRDTECYTYTRDLLTGELVVEYDPRCNGDVRNMVCADVYTELPDQAPGQDEPGQDGESRCDGTGGTQCAIYTYDAQGRETLQGLDPTCDGREARCKHTEYDAQGNILETFQDDCNGGQPSECRRNEYDRDNRLIRSCLGTSCSGDPRLDACTHHEYDERGNWTRSYIIAGTFGNPHYCRTQTYNLANQLLSVEKDDDCDGQPDSWCESFTYNAQGTERMGRTFDCETGECIGSRRVTYNARGLPIEIEFDGECAPPEWLRCERRQYDAWDRLVRTERDRGCDGVDLQCRVFEF